MLIILIKINKEVNQLVPKKENIYAWVWTFISTIQEVVPIAVRIAVAIEAIICTTHLKVSFFVIRFSF